MSSELIKAPLRKMMHRAGMHIVKASSYYPVDWSEKPWSHPLEPLCASSDRNVLIRVPLEKVRYLTLNGFCPTRASRSPFTRTIQDYLDGRCITYAGSALETFYATCTPRTIAERLHMSAPSNAKLMTMPAAAGVPPWCPTPPDHQPSLLALLTECENREHGSRLNATDGCSEFGPVSSKKGELEFARLIRVAQSIHDKGFHVNRQGVNNITATVFLQPGEYRFFIVGGHHRIAALGALGYDVVAMQVSPADIVRRTEAEWWPLVRHGWLSQAEAVEVFDRIFAGRPSSGTVNEADHTSIAKSKAISRDGDARGIPLTGTPCTTSFSGFLFPTRCKGNAKV
jgi:hypothetical protein